MLVLDTNALIFDALSPAHLSRKARGLIERAHTRNDLACSDISLWEIAMLISKGRLDPGISALEFMNVALTARSIAVLPITPEIADLSTKLPDQVSSDPADRLIAATAIYAWGDTHHHRCQSGDGQACGDRNWLNPGLALGHTRRGTWRYPLLCLPPWVFRTFYVAHAA